MPEQRSWGEAVPPSGSSEDKFFLAVQKHGKLEILLKLMDIQLVQAFTLFQGYF